MKELNMVDLRNQWEPLPTPELEAMLQKELEQKPPDDDKVILLLHILEIREKDLPLELSPREAEAWQQYRQRVMARKGKRKLPPRWLSVAASIVLIAAVLVSMVPQQAQAESFWDMLQRMTNTVMEYFDEGDKFGEMDYTFRTDHPGLQQVYDAVLELGVTEPVVPMWIPEGYELKEIDSLAYPMQKSTYASFSNGSGEIIYRINVYSEEPAHQYYKDDTYYEIYEQEGTTYHITRNNERWSVVWTKENTECYLTLDCQEEILWKILESIHVTEAD